MKTIRDLPEEIKYYLSNLEFKHREDAKNIEEELNKFGYSLVDKESIGMYNGLQGYLGDEIVEVEDKRMTCKRCNGEMRVKDYEEPEASEEGLMPCPDCEGEGFIEEGETEE